VTRYSIIHKDGSETPYIWCDKTKQMVVEKIVMQALVYGNGSQESERAKMVLEACGQDVREFILGVDFSDRQFRAEFGSEAEYPQVAIGLNHRGSLKETLKYMSEQGMFL
jgi:hypothetical protein